MYNHAVKVDVVLGQRQEVALIQSLLHSLDFVLQSLDLTFERSHCESRRSFFQISANHRAFAHLLVANLTHTRTFMGLGLEESHDHKLLKCFANRSLTYT